MKEDDVLNNGSTIINKESEETLETVISQPSGLKLLFYFSSFLFFLCSCVVYEISFLSKSKITNNIERCSFLKYEIILYALFYLSSFFLLYFCILLYIRNVNRFEYSYNIVAIVLDKRKDRIASFISFFITVLFSILYNVYLNKRIPVSKPSLKSNSLEEGKDSGLLVHLELEILDRIKLLAFGICIILFLILAKNLLLELINYRMYLNHYNKRIRKNNNDISLLLTLNRSTGKPMEENIRKWATFLYDDLFPQGGPITYYKIEKKFNGEIATKMYELFQCDYQESIFLEEFIHTYCKVIQEKNFLYLNLTQKKNLLSELNIILTILFTFVSIFILNHLNNRIFTVYTAIFDIQTILSLKFIFGSVVSNAFYSIIYIFCVDSFDIGDKLRINNEDYEVVDLGLLYSTFIYKSYVTYVQNNNLRRYKITNYRISEAIDKKYGFRFKTSEYLENQAELTSKIKDYISRNKKNMSDLCEIANYTCDENQYIDIQIKVQFKLPNQNIKNYVSEEDKFKIFLHDTFKSLPLERY